MPSDILRHSNDTEKITDAGSYVKVKEIFNNISGIWRVKFDMKALSGVTAYGRIYRDGTAYGTERSTTSTSYVTFTQDLRFDVTDRIQLFLRSSGYASYASNFRLYGDIIDAIAYNTLT